MPTRAEILKLEQDKLTLTNQNKDLNQRVKDLEKQLKNKNLLQENPIVQDLIKEENEKIQKELNKQIVINRELKQSMLNLKEKYRVLETIKPLEKTDFNKFLYSSITDLQEELSNNDDEYEFIVRDVEIEANVLTEIRNNKPVYILPTTKQITTTKPEMMTRLKYFLSIAPKD